MKASGSGSLASMGPAVPYALARQVLLPRARVHRHDRRRNHADERTQFGITVAKYLKEWKDPRLIVLVLNNRDLNQVTWAQRILTGDIKFRPSQDLPDFPYARFAESIGLRGIRVEKPERTRFDVSASPARSSGNARTQ